MAKPQSIFLVRHGESEANADKTVYGRIPDWQIDLTPLGREQARGAGERLHRTILSIQEARGPQTIGVYLSPYRRAVQTWRHVYPELIGLSSIQFVRQDVRLRELERGNPDVRDASAATYRVTERARRELGTLFYRIPGGESGAEVSDRIASFEETRARATERPDYPSTIVIVGHSFTMRVHMMHLLGLSVDAFHALRDPANAAIVHLTDDECGGYRLVA